MIKQTYDFIADKFREMKIFEKVFPFAELIQTQGGTFPGEYIGEGKFKPINLSAFAGLAYLRKTAPIRFEKSTTESLVGCEIIDLAFLQIRGIASMKKDLLPCDDQWASEFLIEECFRILSGRHRQLSESAYVSDGEIQIQSSESDIVKVLQDEYSGSIEEIPYDRAIIAIDMEIKLSFNKGCILKFCEGYSE